MTNVGLGSLPVKVNDEIDSLDELIASCRFWTNPLWIEIGSYLPHSTVANGLGKIYELQGLDAYVGAVQKSESVKKAFREMDMWQPTTYPEEHIAALLENILVHAIWGYQYLFPQQFRSNSAATCNSPRS